MAEDATPAGGAAMDWSAVGDIPLSEERRSYLAPRLRILLTDFAKLAELEQPTLEPVTTVRPWEDEADASG